MGNIVPYSSKMLATKEDCSQSPQISNPLASHRGISPQYVMFSHPALPQCPKTGVALRLAAVWCNATQYATHASICLVYYGRASWDGDS